MSNRTIFTPELVNASITIIAPHPDDELIGCLSLIETGRVDTVVYLDVPNEIRRQEARTVCHAFSLHYKEMRIEDILCQGLGPTSDNLLLLPSLLDGHILHRRAHMLGEDKPLVGYYSTRMQDGWVREVYNPEAKRKVLDYYYPSQSSLWQYDHRYFLFEGVIIRCPDPYQS